MKLPEIDLKELKKQHKRNFEQRLKFIDFYANWVKSQPNKKWSSQQKNVINK